MTTVIVYHDAYGCDTGCCGHRIELRDDNDNLIDGKFSFEHPYNESDIEFAKRLVSDEYGEDHCANLDWDNCVIGNW